MKNISNILAGIDDNSSERDLMIAVDELIDIIINARRRSKDQAKRNDRRQICKEIKKLLAKGHHTTILLFEGFSFIGIDREGKLSGDLYRESLQREKLGVR